MTKKNIKKLEARATSDSCNKTVKVEINLIKKNRLYNKSYSSRRTLLVHTEKEIKKGEKVMISPTRPISKHNSWKVVE